MRILKRNPKEDYLDKETQWQHTFQIYNHTFYNVLQDVINELNWQTDWENGQRRILTDKKNFDGSFKILEILLNRENQEDVLIRNDFSKTKILSTINIAAKMEEFPTRWNNDFAITVYFRFEKSKKWKPEIFVSSRNASLPMNSDPDNLSELQFNLSTQLMVFLADIFPRFYRPGFFPEFESLQRTGQQEYEAYSSRKKNPKKATKVAKKSARRLRR